ncbi:MAG: 30S ribosomal protein S1 [Lachnospiraceae bacterium]|nr:30S ribosomal protein S1 [Lachnospiraceae bacterium]
MSELSFEQMLEDSFTNIKMGDVVEGTVISVTADEIAVNINYKSDGIIAKNEYTNDSSVDLPSVVKPGDVLNVKVLKMNDGDGQVVLSYKRLLAEKVSEVLKEAFENKTVLKATVSEVVKGGLKVVVDEVPVFIPASLATDTFTKDLSSLANTEVEFIMSEFDPKKRRYIGDCKTVLREKKSVLKKELLEKLQEGDIIDGVVKNVTSFGAFVDIGGVDGLLHISEMSWGRIDNPSSLFRKGDEVKVIVKEINEDKIGLSVKFEENNPWHDAAERYAVGSVVKGKVARMTEFGAFVQLEEGVDALLHVSQISKAHIEKPSDVLKIGDEVEAAIVDVNPDEKRISLSIKELLADEEVAEETTEETAEE